MFRLGRPWGVGKKVYADGATISGYWDQDKFVSKEPQKELVDWFKDVILDDAKDLENAENTEKTLILNEAQEQKKGEQLEIKTFQNIQRQGSKLLQNNKISEHKIPKLQLGNIKEDKVTDSQILLNTEHKMNLLAQIVNESLIDTETQSQQ